jgi:hypothetical protein
LIAFRVAAFWQAGRVEPDVSAALAAPAPAAKLIPRGELTMALKVAA